MANLDISLNNLSEAFPNDFTEEQKAQAQTLFLKALAEKAHQFYKGKIQIMPKIPIWGFNWLSVWYTPGVSKISTIIRDHNDASFELSNRGNTVAVISDSTRVLGDGDCTPAGGLGVMEGKAFLMKYLAGIDAIPLCIDSKDENGENNPQKIIDFVKMCQHSFGAVNLEDISQPNCFKVLDELQSCSIPVWHDDAQGTACVTLAALINALKLAEKKITDARIVLFGAGAANTTVARLLIKDGADPSKIIIFDVHGALDSNRADMQNDLRYYRQWELCSQTNPNKIQNIEEAMKQADVLIALSTPGPNVIKPEWIKLMASRAIVFACSNPVPEIYPYAAKQAGAFIVATGRGDFPNQVNNSLGFPGILKGALLVRAKKITDNMAIAAAHAIASFAEQRGITPENIIPNMEETQVFPHIAAAVGTQAIKDGVARNSMQYDDILIKTIKDIEYFTNLYHSLMDNGAFQPISIEIINEIFTSIVRDIKNPKTQI